MGGGEINLAQIAQELAKRHEVIVLTSFFPHLPVEEVAHKIKIYRKLKTGKKTSTLFGNFRRRFFFPRSITREAQKIITAQKPDIIHFIGTSIIAAPKIKKYHPRLFATIESYPALCPKGDRLYRGTQECTITCTLQQFLLCQQQSHEIGKMKNRWYLKYNPLFLWLTYRYFQQLNQALSSCRLIAISRYVQNILQQYHQESVVIPNAFDAAPFAEVSKKVRNKERNSGKPVILYVGALIRSKGPQILIEALQGTGYRCELYGEGILKPHLQQKIKEYSLDADIFAPVAYDQMPTIYTRADVVVFPSIWPEPFGRIPLEAIAAGKTIVASNIGAIPETVSTYGALVAPNNVKELRQALHDLLLKSKEPKYSLAQYAPAKIKTKLLQAYEGKT